MALVLAVEVAAPPPGSAVVAEACRLPPGLGDWATGHRASVRADRESSTCSKYGDVTAASRGRLWCSHLPQFASSPLLPFSPERTTDLLCGAVIVCGQGRSHSRRADGSASAAAGRCSQHVAVAASSRRRCCWRRVACLRHHRHVARSRGGAASRRRSRSRRRPWRRGAVQERACRRRFCSSSTSAADRRRRRRHWGSVADPRWSRVVSVVAGVRVEPHRNQGAA
jgi:hypothetical protein